MILKTIFLTTFEYFAIYFVILKIVFRFIDSTTKKDGYMGKKHIREQSKNGKIKFAVIWTSLIGLMYAGSIIGILKL